ncbi:spermidine synthase [Opitutus terrae]|uniref:Spermine synthase n=1 Tax=Opitutus terrae (strain DSM 11246 / JCM 15787 / PB90-1) TaxID=452637 RepID=B1ZYY7_OPITP|nr:fused MFS/spermidine synthase [Opitutus terrae]ACB76310.1 Spermine synthase [Opitutus terrae PB90-1]
MRSESPFTTSPGAGRRCRRAWLAALLLPTLLAAAPAPEGDYVESIDTLYNNLTVQRRGTIVELRARARQTEALESAVDLSDPLKLVVAYTRTLYAGLFAQPDPRRVLMIGLGGAGFHRLFAAAYPDSLLQTVELDPKVLELCVERMGFEPTAQTPVAVMDGRMFVKRDRRQWDWLILDAFRGGFVPPHLKTVEFYRECAARLDDRGVFISNLHSNTELYYSDIKTIREVFPQVLLFKTRGWGNVIAVAVKYRTPDITKPASWPPPAVLARPEFAGRLDLAAIRRELIPIPEEKVRAARLLSDDFAPVEFLDSIEANNRKNDD